ncbi:GntR family transcriptional regulator [Pseudonocardia sulfidoxydans NBRC 16205]|uniref:GntR family transcriptional regulator n=2 Tax=Pseudonocardia sulfidoxydans TaxID=54011 RepID=A0A511DQ19_9PSEU|nr:GntR family transcriptional regulator [Pseudonocardia sulfidoxydans NBRC 16205]
MRSVGRGDLAVPRARTRVDVAYRALANELRDAILADHFADGAKLPTEAELSRDRGVSRQTVRRAFQDLVSQGLVYRVPGRGTFASDRGGQYLRQFGSIEDLMGITVDTEFELLIPLHEAVDAAAASRLGVAGERVMSTTFRRIHGGVAFCSTRVFLPLEVGRTVARSPELTQLGSVQRATVIGLIDAVADQPITDAEQVITVAPMPAEISGHLRAAPETPVLRIDRTYYDATGSVVELAISYFLPEHYSYRVRLQRTIH